MNRRNFLRLGALFVPAVVEPTRVYSFIWGRKERYVWEPVPDKRPRLRIYDPDDFEFRIGGIPIKSSALDSWEFDSWPPMVARARLNADLSSVVISGKVSV